MCWNPDCGQISITHRVSKQYCWQTQLFWINDLNHSRELFWIDDSNQNIEKTCMHIHNKLRRTYADFLYIQTAIFIITFFPSGFHDDVNEAKGKQILTPCCCYCALNICCGYGWWTAWCWWPGNRSWPASAKSYTSSDVGISSEQKIITPIQHSCQQTEISPLITKKI